MSRLQARGSDRISNLPDSVIDTILMKMPTIDAVRTSILSRQWRYTWTKLTQFSLDEDMWKSVVVEDSARLTVTTMLWQLMLIHEGPVFKFTLSIPDFESCSIIDNLIIFLSRNNIEDFSLEMWRDFYSVPASIFQCQQLRHLKLQYCRVSNPRALGGFGRLTTLKLLDIKISGETLRNLISKSPLLKLLELGVCCDIGIDIYIDAPNLRKFSFDGYAKSLSLQLMPLLASVSITLDFGKEPFKKCILTQFFQSLPVIESLRFDFCIIEKFVINEPKLSTTLVCLQYLDLILISFEKREVQFTLCLLRSSPNLKSLEIEFHESLLYTSEAILYMRGEDYSEIWLSQLENVVLCGVTGSESEVEFIKLLLAKSPSLESILIIARTVPDNGHAILKEAINFQRASEEAQIIYRE